MAQGTLVLPADRANTFGNTRGFFSGVHQQIYSTGAFNQVPSDEMLITGISFRHPQGQGMDVQVAFLSLTLSTNHRPLEQVSRLADENRGNDAVAVFQTQEFRAITSASTGPDVFELAYNFTQPFYYNRRNGNLVLDMEVSISQGAPSNIDFELSTANGFVYLRRTGTFTEMDVYPATAMVTQFRYEAVPEPGASLLIWAGAALLLVNNMLTENALRHSNVINAKFFNNQDAAGLLLRGYNTTTQKYAQELEDAVQDVMLAF